MTRKAGNELALVHDYLLVMRGAERTFAAIAECWPKAPIYTSVYSQTGTDAAFAEREVRASALQRLRPTQHGFRRLLPLYPWAMAALPVSGHRTVVSSSSAFAHRVRPGRGAVHVCYCHTPFRYAWHEYGTALSEAPRLARPALGAMLRSTRRGDLRAAARVTRYVANSQLVQQRIADAYDRAATVVYPPVEVERFSPGTPEDFFLTVGELTRHKRVEVALEAASRAGRPIKVVGTGPELPRLRARYASVAEFLGRVDDTELARLYASALALVVPGVEEFGIAAVEAQAAGRPVLAVGAGGAAETVRPGVSGVLVETGAVDELAEAMREVDFSSFAPESVRAGVERFGRARFMAEIRAEVARAVASGA